MTAEEIVYVGGDVGTEIVIHDPPPTPAALTLFGTDDPVLLIDKASQTAQVLKGVLERANLTVRIGGSASPYIKAEGWTCLGSLLGVFPRTKWTRKLEDGWEACVEAVTRDGAIVGAAEAQCTRSERNWKNRDEYALRSMAQTRAMSKALRMPLGFIVVLAGYDPTPADEMPREPDRPAEPPPAATPGQVVVTFGKFKGMTIGDIHAEAPDYVKWLAEKSSSETVKDAATKFLADEDIPF